MSANPLTAILRNLRNRLGLSAGTTADSQLLDRFVTDKDEVAFAALFERHAGLVWGVCRRVAGDAHAEDAFQATWIVLSRKASSLCEVTSLPGWLHRVAFRLALAARSKGTPQPLPDIPSRARTPEEDFALREAGTVIDEEVRRLPEKYRLPVLLCFFEGRTHAEAAAELGWPVGTVAGRLARAKDLLHARLTRRGLAPLTWPLVIGTYPPVAKTVGAGALALATAFLAAGVRGRMLVWAALFLVPLVAGLGLLISTPQMVPPGSPQPVPEPQSLPLAARIPHLRMTANNRPGSVSLSPDGKTLATADCWIGIVNPPNGPGDIRGTKLWDLPTGKLKQTLIGGGNLACFSPDGKTLAAVGGTLRLWDLETGKLKFPAVEGYPNDWPFICFSRDGKLVVAGQFLPTGNRVQLLDTATGNVVATLEGDGSRITHLTISPDNTRVVATRDDGTLYFWEVATGKSLHKIRAHTARIVHVCFNPAGTMLATASHDHTAKLWDGTTGKEKATLAGNQEEFRFACFSPDGQTLATLNSTGAKLWDVAKGGEMADLPHKNPQSLAFSPDGKLLATIGDGTKLKLWDVSTGQETKPLKQGPIEGGSFVTFTPDGSTLISFSNVVRLWDLVTGQEQGAMVGHEGAVLCVAISPEGKTIASGGTDETLRFWDRESRTEKAMVKIRRGPVPALRYSPDGMTLATGSADGTVTLWDATTFREKSTLDVKAGGVLSLAYSPDGQLLATGNGDGSVTFWNLQTNRIQAVLRGHEKKVNRVCFSPDGKTLASGGSDTLVKLWDVGRAFEIATFRGPSHEVTGLSFTPDGRTLATGSLNESIRRYDLARKKEISHFHRSGHHGSPVFDLLYSRDGKKLYSANGWKVTVLEHLDLPRYDEYTMLHGHIREVLSICLSEDGNLLVSGGEDGKIYLWNTADMK